MLLPVPRHRTSDEAVRQAVRHFGRELRIAAEGLPQREIARRAGLSQSTVSRIMGGRLVPSVDLMVRLAVAVGHRFTFKLYPQDGVGLRDSGQMSLAEVVRSEAHAIWHIQLEVPIAAWPDRRAGDMLLEQPRESDLIEIERGFYDFQAQLRRAQLKRTALAERLGRRVNLLIGVPDTTSARRNLAPHQLLIRSAMPVTSRRAWSAIRSGEPVGGDALIWIRRRPPVVGNARHASGRVNPPAPPLGDAPGA